MRYKEQAQKIIQEFKGFYLELELSLPTDALQEAQAIYDNGYFVYHKPSIPGHPEGKDWYSTCLHGLGYDKVVSSHAYGYIGNYHDDNLNMEWTEICDLAPNIVYFFKNEFPLQNIEKKYKRLRIMLLKPGGIIPSHYDAFECGSGNILSSVTVPINQPDNCYLKHDNKNTIIPFTPLKTMLLDNSIMHSGKNNSNELRFHILIHHYGNWRDDFWKLFVESFEKNYDNNVK